MKDESPAKKSAWQNAWLGGIHQLQLEHWQNNFVLSKLFWTHRKWVIVSTAHVVC